MPKVYNRIWWSIFIFCIVVSPPASIAFILKLKDTVLHRDLNL
jgi:hypothetical protein